MLGTVLVGGPVYIVFQRDPRAAVNRPRSVEPAPRSNRSTRRCGATSGAPPSARKRQAGGRRPPRTAGPSSNGQTGPFQEVTTEEGEADYPARRGRPSMRVGCGVFRLSREPRARWGSARAKSRSARTGCASPRAARDTASRHGVESGQVIGLCMRAARFAEVMQHRAEQEPSGSTDPGPAGWRMLAVVPALGSAAQTEGGVIAHRPVGLDCRGRQRRRRWARRRYPCWS